MTTCRNTANNMSLLRSECRFHHVVLAQIGLLSVPDVVLSFAAGCILFLQIVPLVMGVGQLKKGQDFDGKFFAFAGKEVPDAYLALPDIMFGQTIALLTSIKVGNTPDTPSPTGTVNRVVKGLTIHKFIK